MLNLQPKIWPIFVCSIRRTTIVAQVKPLPNHYGRNCKIYRIRFSLYCVEFDPS